MDSELETFRAETRVRLEAHCRAAVDMDFDAVMARGDDVLGPVRDAVTVLSPAMRAGQAALAAETAGLAAGAFGMTVAYLRQRRLFGAPISAFQALQDRSAHLCYKTENAASNTLSEDCVLDSGADATLVVSLARARATKTAEQAVRKDVQTHGGIGITDAHDMGLDMKRARVSGEGLGNSSCHAETIARLRGSERG